MSDDNSNAELGIAITNAKAAKNRMSGKGGMEAQHDWSVRYLNERVMAQLIIYCFFVFAAVWAIETPTLIRNGVTFILLFLAGSWVIVANRRKTILEETRQQQLKEHKRSKF